MCAVVAVNRTNVNVKNCYVVGGDYFEAGVLFDGTDQSSISNTRVSNTRRFGYRVINGSTISVKDLRAGRVRSNPASSDWGISYSFDYLQGLTGTNLQVDGATYASGVSIAHSTSVNLKNLDLATTVSNSTSLAIEVLMSNQVSLTRTSGGVFRAERWRVGFIGDLSDYITVTGATMRYNDVGMILASVGNVSVSQSVFTNNTDCDFQPAVHPSNVYFNNTVGVYCPQPR